jgi:hypothetical protein
MSIAARILVAGALSCLLGLAAAPAASPSTSLVVHNTNFAGYALPGPAASPITTFSGAIKMPTVTCPSTSGGGTFSATVQIYDFSGNIAAFTVAGQCVPTAPGFPPQDLSASVQMISTSSPSLEAGASVGVAPGQTVHATITENAPTGFTSLSITNSTTRASGSASTPLVPSMTGVQAGLTLNGTVPGTSFTPIPSFTAFSFIGLKFNGATLATLSPTEYQMYDGSTLQVATSAIGAGGSFNTIFKHV